MNLQEFKTGVEAYRRVEIRSCAIFVLLIALASLPACLIASRIDRTGFDIWCAVAILALVCPASIIGIYAMGRWPQSSLEKLGLLCPHCRKALAGLSSQVVIATGRCGFCVG